MNRIVSHLMRYRRDQSGATAIEYGLFAGLVGMGIVLWATQMGSTLGGFFQGLGTTFAGY